ncbi:MAG: putative bifunctional diguanylate cyclase/phosphodiesterase [Alphaproteobacteria bacterium]
MRRTHLGNPSEKAELALFRAAVAAAGDVVYEWNLTSDKITWSGPLNSIFGPKTSAGIATGSQFQEQINHDDLLLRRRVFTRHVENGEPFDCEYRVRNDSGEFCWVHERGSVELSADGTPARMAGALRIVTARKQNEARLEYQANYDDLTGHYNRTRLREALDQAISYAQRYGASGAYFAIGIDNLTMISEAFGYQTADAVVLAVGQRLDRHTRTSDIVGRIGGQSFGVVAATCPDDDVARIAEKIFDCIRRQPVDTPQGRVHIVVTIGSVLFPEGARTAHDVMAKCEVALQEARTAGGEPFVRYRSTDADRKHRRQDVTVAEQVQDALTSNRLVFAYQPIVAADSHDVLHYECLLRMIGDDGAVRVAGEFMPIIEQLGLVRQIDHYVLERAVKELIENPGVELAINVSGLTASDRSWLRLLAALVRSEHNIAERMTIEITETVALQDIDESAVFVSTARDLGCHVALDDFGAGYSSFRHLKALEVDVVKIDGSFVIDVARNLDNQLFIKTLLGLAQGFNLQTVAECVETIEDAEILARLGVNCLQGYYFGRPEIVRPWLAGHGEDEAEPKSVSAKISRDRRRRDKPARVAV